MKKFLKYYVFSVAFLGAVYMTAGSGKLRARTPGRVEHTVVRLSDLTTKVDRMIADLQGLRRDLQSVGSADSRPAALPSRVPGSAPAVARDPVPGRTHTADFDRGMPVRPAASDIENFKFFIKNTDSSFDPNDHAIVIEHQQQTRGAHGGSGAEHMSRIVATVARLDPRRLARYNGDHEVRDVLSDRTRLLTLTLVERARGRVGDFRAENVNVSAACMFRGDPVDKMDPADIGGSIAIHTYKGTAGRPRCDVYASRAELDEAVGGDAGDDAPAGAAERRP
jgi:hypothetical protein